MILLLVGAAVVPSSHSALPLHFYPTTPSFILPCTMTAPKKQLVACYLLPYCNRPYSNNDNRRTRLSERRSTRDMPFAEPRKARGRARQIRAILKNCKVDEKCTIARQPGNEKNSPTLELFPRLNGGREGKMGAVTIVALDDKEKTCNILLVTITKTGRELFGGCVSREPLRQQDKYKGTTRRLSFSRHLSLSLSWIPFTHPC